MPSSDSATIRTVRTPRVILPWNTSSTCKPTSRPWSCTFLTKWTASAKDAKKTKTLAPPSSMDTVASTVPNTAAATTTRTRHKADTDTSMETVTKWPTTTMVVAVSFLMSSTPKSVVRRRDKLSDNLTAAFVCSTDASAITTTTTITMALTLLPSGSLKSLSATKLALCTVDTTSNKVDRKETFSLVSSVTTKETVSRLACSLTKSVSCTSLMSRTRTT
mmetsp:Transcript_22928/g.37216  ORF Transcript_22928/g.37216 Transcript_22928/m.37216 type:complete len:219 (-) Transcript_22928:985-1641(-)